MRRVETRIGGLNLTISQLGFGCARLFAGPERRHSERLIERAYEIGIRHFDTAPSYGHGQSEAILGEVFSGSADVTIMTKVGVPRPMGAPRILSILQRQTTRRVLSHFPGLKKKLLRGSSAQGGKATIIPKRKVLLRDAVIRALEESLIYLRRDRVDFYCIHEPEQFVVDDELLEIFRDLKDSRLIGAHGLAWGGKIQSAPIGWDVMQAHYDDQPQSGDGVLRFFHGVLRSSHSDGPTRLKTALRRNQDAVFVVSASEPHQLTDLARKLF